MNTHSNGEKGYVLILLLAFLPIVVTFLIELGPMCQRIITEINVRHAVDVATLKGVHTEVYALNTITSMNHVLLVVYAVIAGCVINPELWEAIPKLIDGARAIAKLQDEIVQLTPGIVRGTIMLEMRNWDYVLMWPDSTPGINVRRSPSLFGIPGILILEEGYEEGLRVKVTGHKLKKLMNFGNAFSKTPKFKYVKYSAEGEPDGESLLKRTWRTKPLQ